MSYFRQAFDANMAQLTAPGAPYELAGSDESGHYYAKAPANLVEAMSVARQHGDRAVCSLGKRCTGREGQQHQCHQENASESAHIFLLTR